ncbi:MAG: hypothetical protein AAB390_00155 [Patescibacteria group bacterium]
MSVHKKNKKQKTHHRANSDGDNEQTSRDRATIKKMVGTIPALIIKEGYFDKINDSANKKIESAENEEIKNADVIAEKEIKNANAIADGDLENMEDNSGNTEENSRVPLTDWNEKRNESEIAPMVITHPKKIIWLWTGVTIVTLMIFAIWIFNIRNVFYDVRNSQGFEETLLTNSRRDLADIWKSIQANDEIIADQLKKETTATSTDADKALDDLLNEIMIPILKTSSTKE